MIKIPDDPVSQAMLVVNGTRDERTAIYQFWANTPEGRDPNNLLYHINAFSYRWKEESGDEAPAAAEQTTR